MHKIIAWFVANKYTVEIFLILVLFISLFKSHYITPKIKELILYFFSYKRSPFLPHNNITDNYHPYAFLHGIRALLGFGCKCKAFPDRSKL